MGSSAISTVKRVARTRRGVYLISTLLLLTFLVMLGGAVAVSFQQGLASSNSFNNRQLALNAAMNGLTYLQARLESNPSVYGPGYRSTSNPYLFKTLDGTFSVRESQDTTSKAVNVCGFMSTSVSGVAGAGDATTYTLFRASFNGSYSTFSAMPQKVSWSFVNFNGVSWQNALGDMPYVSMNNLLRSSQLTAGTSYTSSGGIFKTVPGGTADVIVEGMVVTSDGTIITRRSVECMYNLNGMQSSSSAGAATAATDMNLNVYQSTASGGAVNVGAATTVNESLAGNAGLAANNGNINITGVDVSTSTTSIPGYSATSKASLNGSGRALTYKGTGQTVPASITTSTQNQNLVQDLAIAPPSVQVSDLPTQATPATLGAGTWVVWNNAVYHYPVDYDTSVPLNTQASGPTAKGWSGGTGGSAPTYNGTGPDAQTLPAGVAFDNKTNTLTVSSDVLVSSANGANGFAFVVAPSSNQSATGTNSANVGSAQIVFDASGGSTPQLRSPGSVAVMGNVTGQGAMVTTGLTAGSASAGDITVVGKSSLDPRSDSGVALYSAGDVNMLQLSYAQSPSTVPSVGTTLSNAGVTAGSGASGSITGVNITSESAAVYSALTQAMQVKSGQLSSRLSYDAASLQYSLNLAWDNWYSAAKTIKDANPVTVTYMGTTYSGRLKDVLYKIADAAGDGTSKWWIKEYSSTAIGGFLVTGMGNVTTPLISASGFTTTGSGGTWFSKTSTFSASTFASYQSSGTNVTTTTATASPGTSTGTVAPAALNQTFSGLVYASKNLNMRNALGNISVNGMVVAYGGTPGSTSYGTNGGSLNLSANAVSLLYDPSTLGPYLYLFGGVKLRVGSLANF